MGQPDGEPVEAHVEPRLCQMCGSAAPDGATACASCGATLATRESLGGLVIPGVTAVDPGLAAYDAQPWRLVRSSPSQSMAGGTVVAAAALGGPAGLVALAGLAAVAATEYAGASRGAGGVSPGLEDVGRPLEPALKMLEQLQREDAARTAEGGPSGAADRAEGAKPPDGAGDQGTHAP